MGPSSGFSEARRCARACCAEECEACLNTGPEACCCSSSEGSPALSALLLATPLRSPSLAIFISVFPPARIQVLLGFSFLEPS